MAAIDVETRLRKLSPAKVRAHARQCLTFPSIYSLTETDSKTAQDLLDPSTARVGGFIRWQQSRVTTELRKGRYQDAMDLVKHSAVKARGEFQGNEVASALLTYFSLRGLVLEHFARKTDFRFHPDVIPSQLFLMAADTYMQIDLAMELVTPFAHRVAACFLEAGERRLAVELMSKLYGPQNTIIFWPKGDIDLGQKFGMSKPIGKVPFAGSIRNLNIGKVPTGKNLQSQGKLLVITY